MLIKIFDVLTADIRLNKIKFYFIWTSFVPEFRVIGHELTPPLARVTSLINRTCFMLFCLSSSPSWCLMTFINPMTRQVGVNVNIN